MEAILSEREETVWGMAVVSLVPTEAGGGDAMMIKLMSAASAAAVLLQQLMHRADS